MSRSTRTSTARFTMASSGSERHSSHVTKKGGSAEPPFLFWSCSLRLFRGVRLLVEAHGGEDFGADIFRALLLDMLRDARADRHHGFAHEGRAVVARPVERGFAVFVEALELREDIARHQFVGALGVFPVGPVMRELHEAAKAARLRLEA